MRHPTSCRSSSCTQPTPTILRPSGCPPPPAPHPPLQHDPSLFCLFFQIPREAGIKQSSLKRVSSKQAGLWGLVEGCLPQGTQSYQLKGRPEGGSDQRPLRPTVLECIPLRGPFKGQGVQVCQCLARGCWEVAWMD